jgi:hypothetical protein
METKSGEMDRGGSTVTTIILSGILKVKLPESRQNLIKSAWRERSCVLETNQTHEATLKIFKSNPAKSTPKLYHTIHLSKGSSVWKDSNVKSSIFYVREVGQEIGFTCSSPTECDQWISTLHTHLQDHAPPQLALSHTAPLLRVDTFSVDHKQEDGDLSSVSDSVHYPPALVSQTSHPSSPSIIGGNNEPSRIEKMRSSSSIHLPLAPDTPVVPLTAPASIREYPKDSPPLNRIPSSKVPDRLDVPSFTAPLGLSESATVPPSPFWMHLDPSAPYGAEGANQPSQTSPILAKKPLPPASSEGRSSVPIAHPRRPIAFEVPPASASGHLPPSPVRREPDVTDKLRKEISELIELNNALHQKIDELTETGQRAERDLQNERLLSQQRVEDLKTRNLLTNEECRSLREETHRLKREMKEMISRQEEESLRNASAATLPQQVDTYRQLSETLARENLKLSTDVAKLGKQTSEHEGQERKSVATIKLLLEKNVALEQEVAILEQRLDQERRAKEEERQQREDLSEKFRDVSSKYKRVETELRKLQSRVQQEVQSEVCVETERMLVLEEECDRLQKEIFLSKSERDRWEIENIRLSQELSDLRAALDASSPQTLSEIQRELEASQEKVRSAESTIAELNSQLHKKETGWDHQRDDLNGALTQSRADLKEAKRSWKLHLQAAEAKTAKMQTEILRLVSDSPPISSPNTEHRDG